MYNEHVKIREYVPTDKAEILRMFMVFGKYIAEIDVFKRTIVANNYAEVFFNEMLENTTKHLGKIWVVEEKSGGLAGFVAGNITKLTPDNTVESVPCTKGRILELYVEEKQRGQGFGKKLVEQVMEYFSNNSCDVVNVEVFAPNEEAYAFYKRLGFINRNYDLIKILSK